MKAKLLKAYMFPLWISATIICRLFRIKFVEFSWVLERLNRSDLLFATMFNISSAQMIALFIAYYL